MYVARHGDSRLIKRMPLSGFKHAPWCPHHGPATNLGTAQRQDGDAHDDATSPKAAQANAAIKPDPVQQGRSQAGRVRLLVLLHELWSRADLTRWHPGFAGKRHWGIVRRHLMRAARQIRTPACAIAQRLYIPEVFNVQRADRIRERREARWNWITREAGDGPASMLTVGELKSLRPGQRFARAWLKHVPDSPFLLRGEALRQIERRHEAELAAWGGNLELHMVCIATVAPDPSGSPTVVDIELMLCSPEWIPLTDENDQRLVAALVEAGLCFTKELDEAGVGSTVALAAVLCGPPAPLELFIDRRGDQDHSGTGRVCNPGERAWVWRPAVEPLPHLPARRAPATAGPSERRSVDLRR